MPPGRFRTPAGLRAGHVAEVGSSHRDHAAPFAAHTISLADRTHPVTVPTLFFGGIDRAAGSVTTPPGARPGCRKAGLEAPVSCSGFVTRTPYAPAARASAARPGSRYVAPWAGRPETDISNSTISQAELMKRTTLTGRWYCTRVRKSPLGIEKPPSPDIDTT